MPAEKVLITGGAGYIGKCLAWECERQGLHPIILDNFCASAPHPILERWPLIKADLANADVAKTALVQAKGVVGIFHLAALALVSESCKNPERYFANNLNATINLADWASKNGNIPIIHSSTCAVYGAPPIVPISETSALQPLSPYGASKLAAENILNQFQSWKGLPSLHLRYFNPAGSVYEGWLGESHEPETHLVPSLIKAALLEKPFNIFGNDYPTSDGTCIRDLLHVADVAEAHLLALKYLRRQSELPPSAINLGGGKGYSVAETVAAARHVLQRDIRVEVQPRRPGDPPSLVADPSNAQRLLGWRATRTLETILFDHLLYEQKRRSDILN